MNNTVRVLMLMTVIAVPPALANNREDHLPLQPLMEEAQTTQVLGTDIKFYFGPQPYPAVAKDLGEVSSNRKTNAVFKSDAKSCRWAMLSALKAFADRARKLGGNAVIEIRSKDQALTESSASEYECHAGATISGVALTGRVVLLGP